MLHNSGAGWTAARNAPGSFALFGGSAFVKEYLFHLNDYNQATFFQNFCASIGGAVASITVAAPLDVVKTRIQNRNFDNPESGLNIIKDLIKKEGFGGFFKGLTPKILVVCSRIRKENARDNDGLIFLFGMIIGWPQVDLQLYRGTAVDPLLRQVPQELDSLLLSGYILLCYCSIYICFHIYPISSFFVYKKSVHSCVFIEYIIIFCYRTILGL